MHDIDKVLILIDKARDRFIKANDARAFQDESLILEMPVTKLKAGDLIAGSRGSERLVVGYEPFLIDEIIFDHANGKVLINGVHLDTLQCGRHHKIDENVWIVKTVGNALRNL